MAAVTATADLSTIPSLEDAFEACRQETAEWAKTFYLGTLLMPPAKRRAIWANLRLVPPHRRIDG